MIRYLFPIIAIVLSTSVSSNAQSTVDSIQMKKVFSTLQEALINPKQVYKLNLSNQTLKISDSTWSKFTNLKYLSLKNDHFKSISPAIGNLHNLEFLDLSGNDFESLPSTFSKLTNLKELYLNDEKHFKLQNSIPIISSLPNLKVLHIEHNNMKSLPENTYKLKYIEELYLNENKFKQFPVKLMKMENLKYIDFRKNKLRLPLQNLNHHNDGIKIKF